jgi:hypothetical protein
MHINISDGLVQRSLPKKITFEEEKRKLHTITHQKVIACPEKSDLEGEISRHFCRKKVKFFQTSPLGLCSGCQVMSLYGALKFLQN